MDHQPAAAAGVFGGSFIADLARLAAALSPRLDRLDRAFCRSARARGCDAPQVRALCAIAPGAALRFFGAGRPPADFFEQVEYNARRLAKLNLPPQQALDILRAYELPGAGPFRAALDQLRLGVALALNSGSYQVREAETQAFYGLFRAEADAHDLDALLRRSIEILTRALRAQAGRLALLEGEVITPALVRRVSRPLYIEAGSPREGLVLDPALRGRHACYWSIPFRGRAGVEAVAQFGFATAYPWLPRELTLLEAAAERCLAAVERARLASGLATREEQVRRLAGHLLRAEEDERRRIGRDLHDEAGQSMLLLRLQLEKMEKSAGGKMKTALHDAGELAARAIEEVRRAVAALSPAVLERLGLEAALRQLAARFGRSCHARFSVRIAKPLPAMDIRLATVLYRVAQECCRNAARHADASRVNLSLASSDSCLELSIADDGAGFDVDAASRKPDSFGLAGMRERVALFGGKFEVRSRPGRGSVVVARLPLGAAAPGTG